MTNVGKFVIIIYENKDRNENGRDHPMRRSQGVNITRIAREAGLSIASVSRAMNGRNGVSEDVRRRVNELLRKHNYIGNNT